MSETNKENLLAGSTNEAQDGTKSLPVMKDGEEPLDMLLAILNSPLQTMLANNQARILGTGLTNKGVGTFIVVYGVVPTSEGLLAESEKK